MLRRRRWRRPTRSGIAAAHAEWDRRHAAPLRGDWQPLGHGGEPAVCLALTPGSSPRGRGEDRAFTPNAAPGGRGEQQRPLRLGFVSRHFRQHPVGCMIVRAIECLGNPPSARPSVHDARPLPVGEGKRSCAVFCYSDTPRPDAITARFIASSDCWRDVGKLSDDALAEQNPRRSDRHPLRSRRTLGRQSAAGICPQTGAHPNEMGRLEEVLIDDLNRPPA